MVISVWNGDDIRKHQKEIMTEGRIYFVFEEYHDCVSKLITPDCKIHQYDLQACVTIYMFVIWQVFRCRLVTTKENDRKIALYSIHSNPCNSYEFCVGGRDHYIRYVSENFYHDLSQ